MKHFLFLAALGLASAEPNLNGDYKMSKTPKGRDDVFSMRFADYPGTVEYFDIYSPVLSSVYSQVIWTTFPPIALPDEIVKRFAGGKPMAILGMESDQVRNTTEGEEVSVPITWTYNHHYGPNIIGHKAKIVKVLEGDPRIPRTGHPTLVEDGMVTIVVDDKTQPFPTSRNFNTANGGEMRKSFKGMPPGAAYIVQSPHLFQLEAMQIDTWNREKMTGAKFYPGPLPRNSLAPADAEYSGLLECPMTTRIQKVLAGAYSVQLAGACADAITSLEECRAALSQLTSRSPINITKVTSAAHPAGCSAAFLDGDGSAMVGFFNDKAAAPTVDCGHNSTARRSGSSSTLVDLKVDLAEDATLTITGPATVWFGVGFNATSMADRPWTVVVDGDGNVTERHLAFHDPGTALPPSVRVVSNTVQGGKRTVVLSRPLKGKGGVFSFSAARTELNFITALGSGPAFAIHRNHTASSLAMFAVDGPSCVCAEKPAPFGQGTGMLVYSGPSGGGQLSEQYVSPPFPSTLDRSPLLALVVSPHPTPPRPGTGSPTTATAMSWTNATPPAICAPTSVECRRASTTSSCSTRTRESRGKTSPCGTDSSFASGSRTSRSRPHPRSTASRGGGLRWAMPSRSMTSPSVPRGRRQISAPMCSKMSGPHPPRPVLRLFPACALIAHAQGSSGVVDNMPFAWRGHTKSLTTRSRPSPNLAVWLE